MNNFEPFKKIFFDRPGLFWFLSKGNRNFHETYITKPTSKIVTYDQKCFVVKTKLIKRASLLRKEITEGNLWIYFSKFIRCVSHYICIGTRECSALKRFRDSKLNSCDLPNQIKTKLAKIWNFPRFLSILCLLDFGLNSLIGKLLVIISIFRLLSHYRIFDRVLRFPRSLSRYSTLSSEYISM